ncbi:glycosyltransferase family A protein [Paucibacter sp. KCTC 42545]|uniref:glycosyltransferase family A protein n=1 Tax=Paucibacter sp. KCTC 42545 TaxID=1768242 RepID=UPI0012E3EDE7|nr:glycosyltransferase family A protein [Paucibacter sp. KCTC 42545]
MQVTTLIPAYKTKYIVELLTGLMTQTLKPQKVIVSDDSPDGVFGALLQSPQMELARRKLQIEVHTGPRAGAYENFKHLLRLWDGSTELVHLLLDDDILYPDFYLRHLMAHASCRSPSSISARWCTNERGQPVEGMPIPKNVWFSNDRIVLLEASLLFSSTLPDCTNWLGEFSNCVMRKEAADLLFSPQFAGVSYEGLWDLGAFLAASLIGPVAYIQDRLGAFRAGGEGHSAQLLGKHMKAAHLAYAALSLGAVRLERLSPDSARKGYAGLHQALLDRYTAEPDVAPFIPVLGRLAAGEAEAEAEFLLLWEQFLRSHKF